MSIQRWPPAETKFAEFEQFLPHGRDIGSVRFERLTESNCDRVWDPLRKFPEKSSTLKRKDRAPELVEPDRNDCCIRGARGGFRTAFETQTRSRAFEPAFRKNAYNLALRDFFRCRANRGVRLAASDGNATEHAQKRVQDRFVIILLIDDVADRAGAAELQNDAIHPADMVRQKKKPA